MLSHPKRVQAQAILVDDWSARAAHRPIAEPRSLDRSFPATAIRSLAEISNGAITGLRRNTGVPADLWILDASYRLGAPR